jgi:excisionase family DNA binding protein
MNVMTAKELAQTLGISPGTVYKMVNAGKLPAIRIGTGRTLRFDLDEVKKALAKELPRLPSHRASAEDPLLTIHRLAIETGIKDLAQRHDHYLYGLPAR